MKQPKLNQSISIGLKMNKKKRKFRAMTMNEYCNQTTCQKCEYYDNTYGCYYGKFNNLNVTYDYHNKPYKSQNGKCILVEVKQ